MCICQSPTSPKSSLNFNRPKGSERKKKSELTRERGWDCFSSPRRRLFSSTLPFSDTRIRTQPRDSRKSQVVRDTLYNPPSPTQRSYVPCSLLTVSGWPDGRAPNKHTSCAHMHACIRTHTSARMHARIHIHIHTYAHTQTCTCTNRITHMKQPDGWVRTGRRDEGQLKWSSLVYTRQACVSSTCNERDFR